ncbi:MAG: hypothetical protein FWH17_10550 [Oscillospiraceae bacterium]|nr:hypothetical protein [Oscillospiraceae bacterium]
MIKSRGVTIADTDGMLTGDAAMDVSLIPEHAAAKLGRWALGLAKDILERPGEKGRYQEWLKQRRLAELKEESP